MRWSLSTKVFLSLATVIFVFGGVGIYSIYEMHRLRNDVTLIRDGVLPLTSDLETLIRELKVYDEELSASTRPDLIRLRSYFPTFTPFTDVAKVERLIEQTLDRFNLDGTQHLLLTDLASRLEQIRTSSELRDALIAKSSTPLVKEMLNKAPAALSNESVYRLLAGQFVVLLHEEKIQMARQVQDALGIILRRMRNDLAEVRRMAKKFMDRVEFVAQSAGSKAQLIISVAAGGALIVAIAVMIWIGMTLKPLTRLREGVRRVAVGDFTTVNINSTDEIGQLAGEFNSMAASLTERDNQLENQRKDLVRAERLATIGKMSSQITHEIRNPLSSIGLNSELLEEELGENDEARTLLSAIRAEIDRLTDVTQQYLRFARLPKPSLRPEELNTILADLLEFMSSEIKSASATVSIHLEDGLPLINADEDQLRQAFLNLLRNSLESLNKGGNIVVETSSLNGVVTVIFSDSGSGIDRETQDKIFEPFFTTKTVGTGLGLTLVQQIIHEHGGKISCESDSDSGTRFILEFPEVAT